MEEFLKGIDWKGLVEQKEHLIEMSISGAMTQREIITIGGILGLIDHIQDSAVDSGLYTEEQVFGKREEE